MIERTIARRVIGLFQGHLVTHFTAVFDHAVDSADVATDKKRLPTDAADVGGAGVGDWQPMPSLSRFSIYDASAI
jgi:hypothetical protein